MRETYDAAIVGGGLAGSHAFRLLAARGLRVVLIERKQRLGSRVHTTGVFVRKTLEDFDLPGDVLGPAVRRVALYGPAMRRITLESPHEEFRAADMGALYERFAGQGRRSGGEVLCGVKLASLEASAGGSVLHLRRGMERIELRARFVIGADGARSRVARGLGLDTNRRLLVGFERVYAGFPLAQGETPIFHCLLDPRLAPGYLAWLIRDGRHVHIGTAGLPAPGFDPRSALDVVVERFRAVVDVSGIEPTEKRGGFIPVGGVLRRIASPRGLLIGDAAGAVSPLTAGGLDGALRLTGLGAEVAAAYLATGNPRSLARYDGAAFRTRFTSRLFMRTVLERLRHPGLVDAAVRALDTPPGRWLAWQVFFGRNSFPEPAEVGQRRLAAV